VSGTIGYGAKILQKETRTPGLPPGITPSNEMGSCARKDGKLRYAVQGERTTRNDEYGWNQKIIVGESLNRRKRGKSAHAPPYIAYQGG